MTAVAERPLVAPRVVRTVWGGLLATLAGAPLLYGLAAARPYTAGPSPVFGAPSASLTRVLTTGLSALVVGAALTMIVLALPVARRPRHGTAAVLGALAFSGSIVLSAWWHGAGISIGLLALPAVVAAMSVFPRPPRAWFEGAVVLTLRVWVWGSLAAGVVVPSWALQRGSVGAVLPGVTTRLAGLANHPNTLGAVTVVLVVLEWHRRPRSRLPLGAALLALAWTQSKTSWAALALVAGLALVRTLRSRSPRGSRLPALAMLAVFGFTAYVGLGLLGDTRTTDRTDVSTETFTGRTAIWEVTLEVWRDDPVLGVGTALWDDAMDRRYASRVGFPPGHAHNQLVQTLGQAGLVGAAALLVFLVGWGGLARRADVASGGAAGALFLAIIVRCFSEPPLQGTPYGASLLLVAVTFGYALIAADE